MNQPFDHAIDWRQPGPVLKVSGGRVLYIERHPDGAITERDVFDWNQTWGGTWTCSDGRLTISVGSYTLQTDPHSTSAVETNRDDPRHANIPFLVLPVLLPGDQQPLGTGNEALVKFIQGHRVFLAELGYGGVVREYPLVLGEDPEAWSGAWSHEGTKLSINVGDYAWTGVIDERDGLVRGTETMGNQRYELNGVLVRVWSLGNAGASPEERQAAYAGSTLDRARLEQYAARVAAATTLATTIPPVSATVTRQVTELETYRAGLFGRRRETRPVSRTIESREVVMGPGWLLFETKHWIDEYNTARYKVCEYAEANQWVLDTNGGLWTVWDWTEFAEYTSGGTNRSAERTARPMTDADILALDCDYPDRIYPSQGRDDIRGNRQPGQIIRHAKGMGLSLALRNLLDGAQSFDRTRPGDRAR